MSKRAKDPAVYLWDMLYEIEWMEQTITAREQLYDPIIGRAVLRSFTVLGEAAKRVDEPTRARASQVPWQKIIDTRNFISHEYEEINLQMIGDIIAHDLPQLKTNLLALYQSLTGTDYAH